MRDVARILFSLCPLAGGAGALRTLNERATERAFHQGYQGRSPWLVSMPRKGENVVVVQPKLADDDEADKPAQKLGKQLKQRRSKFVGAPVVVQSGNLKFEHEQRNDNRKDAIAESLNSCET